MSEPSSPQPAPAPASPAASRPAPDPKVRLQTWVNVILVLILLGSCGSSQLSAGQVADAVVDRLGGAAESSGGMGPSSEDVVDLCRLVGAQLVKDGVSPATALPSDESISACQMAAQEATGTATK